MQSEKCPFKAGDVVTYRPSMRGRGQSVMTDLADLVPGRRYHVASIQKEYYVVLKGYENSPAGGLYWTEFVLDTSPPSPRLS